MNTSLITILSSEHGRLRREQRDIDKRDLQKALKYGELSRQWSGRWKVEYDGITFIVDNALRREITCYPSPLATAPVSLEDTTEHDKTKELGHIKEDIFKSHTVIVVDNSGSMRTHDINLHRDRHSAVYTLTALEFVAEQLFNKTANNSDLVSLVEFNRDANVVFRREPISWVLYNRLLSRRDDRRFVERERSKAIDFIIGDSNYLPALKTAEELLATGDHEGLALSLLFLSDGAPTDAHKAGLTSTAAEAKMCDKVREVSRRFKGRLNILMVGFGNAYNDFSVLKAMAQAGVEELDEAHASFVYCEKAANAIGTAITSLVSSTTMTRTELMDRSHGKTLRNISSESETQQYSNWKFFKILKHFVYDPKRKRMVPYRGIPPGALKGYTKEDVTEWWQNPPPFFAMNSHHCGKGAERLAFRCRLSNDMTEKGFVLQEMVAKETNLVERIEENMEFHRLFLEGQNLASHLAEEFNKRLCALPNYDVATTPKLFFLPCSVLQLRDEKWKGGKRGMLVEKKLDTDRFRWCKWNDNAGGVDGKAAHVAIDVEYEFKTLHKDNLCEMIPEGDSEEEESDSEDSESSDEEETIIKDHISEKASDYLQAFTHFTYLYTNKKAMVCDLQGVYNDEHVPPVFELTDPVVHYASKSGRRMVFGRTDKGPKGMQLFFNTHVCTRICKLMNLSKKNPQWKKKMASGAKRNCRSQVDVPLINE